MCNLTHMFMLINSGNEMNMNMERRKKSTPKITLVVITYHGNVQQNNRLD